MPRPSVPDVERPSPQALTQARRGLERALGVSKVLAEPALCAPYGADDSEAMPSTPDLVALASCADDIVAALRVASETGVPLTPRAGGTGRTGGAVPVAGGIVLALTGMASIKEIDRAEGLCVVEPGVVLADLHAAVEAEGLFYPPDPGSLASCTLGGNVAENAGGPRAFKYGVTGNYVLGLEAFLIGGQRFFAGRRTRKGVTGYDVARLLVGSEGTLAVFGDLTLRLVPKPPAVMTLLALFTDVRAAAAGVESLLATGVVPRSLELLDARTLQALRDAGNPVDAHANAMLLLDLDGDEASCDRDAERIGSALEGPETLDLLGAQDVSQRARLWAARRAMSPALRRMARHKLGEDVVVPRRCMVELLERVERLGEREHLRTATYGHAGDGNLHVNFLWDEPEEALAVERAVEQLFRDVIELGGTLSGEHGIGLTKAPYLGLEQSEPLIALQRGLKAEFDPRGLLNPGKLFPRREGGESGLGRRGE